MAPPHVPIEIWRIVCEKLAADNFCAIGSEFDEDTVDDDQSDIYVARDALKALCRVSRGIAEVAQAALFKCYYMDEKGDRDTHLKFLRAVLDSRDRLATYVREVHLENFVYSETRGTRLTTDPELYLMGYPDDVPSFKAEETASMYERMVRRLGFDVAAFPFDPDDLVRFRSRRKRVPAVVVLTLLLLHNVEVLRVTLGFETQGFGLLQELRASGVVAPFGRIKDLTLGYHGFEGFIDGHHNFCSWNLNGFMLTRFAPLLALTPNVTTLRLDRCRGLGLRETDSESDTVQTMRGCMPPNVKALELPRSRLRNRDMGILLACCNPGLERFRYQSWSPGDSDEVTPRQLVSHLLPFRATLKEVELDYLEPSRWTSDTDYNQKELKTLLTDKTHFTELLALESFVLLIRNNNIESDDDEVD